MTDSKHAPAECPRCNRLFDCKANTPHRCNCVNIALTAAEIQFIREEMMDENECLCSYCLDDLRHLHSNATLKLCYIKKNER